MPRMNFLVFIGALSAFVVRLFVSEVLPSNHFVFFVFLGALSAFVVKLFVLPLGVGSDLAKALKLNEVGPRKRHFHLQINRL